MKKTRTKQSSRKISRKKTTTTSKRSRPSYKKKVSKPRKRRNTFISHNFSDVEDNSRATRIIRKLAAHAGNNAAAEAKAAGISRVYARNNKELIKVSASGDVIAVVPKVRRSSFYVKYKPSTILRATKK